MKFEKNKKCLTKYSQAGVQPGPSFGTFVRIFFPQENQMLIMNDNINARAPLPSRAPTPIIPFERTCSGFQSRRLKQQEVLK